jgi:hypothetical protein
MFLSRDFKLSRYGLDVRLVTISDSEFIVNIRNNEKLSRFINYTSSDVNKQIEWIKQYKIREEKRVEYYLIFLKGDEKLGVNRIYNINEDSFTTGSWIFSRHSPKNVAILSDIITREIAFFNFPNHVQLFDVRKMNKSVVKYHERFEPTLISQDEENFYYKITFDTFEKNKNKYLRILTK